MLRAARGTGGGRRCSSEQLLDKERLEGGRRTGSMPSGKTPARGSTRKFMPKYCAGGGGGRSQRRRRQARRERTADSRPSRRSAAGRRRCSACRSRRAALHQPPPLRVAQVWGRTDVSRLMLRLAAKLRLLKTRSTRAAARAASSSSPSTSASRWSSMSCMYSRAALSTLAGAPSQWVGRRRRGRRERGCARREVAGDVVRHAALERGVGRRRACPGSGRPAEREVAPSFVVLCRGRDRLVSRPGRCWTGQRLAGRLTFLSARTSEWIGVTDRLSESSCELRTWTGCSGGEQARVSQR